jgi:hypothetical protein
MVNLKYGNSHDKQNIANKSKSVDEVNNYLLTVIKIKKIEEKNDEK